METFISVGCDKEACLLCSGGSGLLPLKGIMKCLSPPPAEQCQRRPPAELGHPYVTRPLALWWQSKGRGDGSLLPLSDWGMSVEA